MGLSLLLDTEEYVKVILRRHCCSIYSSIVKLTSTGNRSPGLMFVNNVVLVDPSFVEASMHKLNESLAQFEMEGGSGSCKAKTYLWSKNIVICVLI
ncbi:hypothetical protein GAYE_PCTG44G1045 [Galdieria yellowstonensis]|uniref:Uncharacterized protein n=1 Tax=Galdieria yellowstonensis TaxID=3028027 RepID=A0AAV9I6W4_9RHOD|nr:hypothetical protein GAYE_PCTG44G1045 [Galdieria yellowstonensis]